MNLPPLWSTVISLVFLASGAVALSTMLAVQGRRQAPDYRRYAGYHRWAGWLFVGLFLVMFLFMLARVESYWEESSARIALHVTLATALFLLLALKVLIPRLFPKLLKNMFLLGTSVYLLAFTLVWITAGYYLIWKDEKAPYLSHAELPAHVLDRELGQQLFIDKCSTCHLLENIMRTRGTGSWEEVMNRMVELAAPRISPGEAAQILHYLVLSHTPKPYQGPPEQATVEGKFCLPCHRPAEILQRELSRAGWRELIKRMRRYDPQIIPADRIDELVDYFLEQQKSG